MLFLDSPLHPWLLNQSKLLHLSRPALTASRKRSICETEHSLVAYYVYKEQALNQQLGLKAHENCQTKSTIWSRTDACRPSLLLFHQNVLQNEPKLILGAFSFVWRWVTLRQDFRSVDKELNLLLQKLCSLLNKQKNERGKETSTINQ